MTSPVSLAFSVRVALMTVSERPNADRYSQHAVIAGRGESGVSVLSRTPFLIAFVIPAKAGIQIFPT